MGAKSAAQDSQSSTFFHLQAIGVRAAQPQDRMGILALCEALHAENAQHPICWPKVRQMVDRGIARDNAVFGVVGPLGEPVGAVLLLLDPVWYSDEFQLIELFNFVHRDHRKTGYAKSLIEYAKGCSDALRIDLTIGVLSHERMQAKVRLYRRLLPEAGAFFCHRPAPIDLPLAAE